MILRLGAELGDSPLAGPLIKPGDCPMMRPEFRNGIHARRESNWPIAY